MAYTQTTNHDIPSEYDDRLQTCAVGHAREDDVFQRLEKNSLFYDPVISRPQLLWQDFVVNFATSTRVYTGTFR